MNADSVSRVSATPLGPTACVSGDAMLTDVGMDWGDGWAGGIVSDGVPESLAIF